MGKNDFLSPKAIANRIKAKGLQKLRWYCQMCGKQCRDENGFKCHLSSDAHRRQMEVFGQAPERIIEGYSEEFQKAFLEHLTRCHPRARVLANKVYNEFIADRDHVHMNSTKWLTLTDFVADLGRQGVVRVDEDPLGLHIRLVRQDDRERELEADRRVKRERLEESRKLRDLEERAKLWAQQETAAKEGGGGGERGEESARGEGGAEKPPVDLAEALAASSALSRRRTVARSAGAVFSDGSGAAPGRGEAGGEGAAASGGDGASAAPRDGAAKPRSKIEELMEQELRRKERRGRREREGGREDAGGAGERSGDGSRDRSGERSKEEGDGGLSRRDDDGRHADRPSRRDDDGRHADRPSRRDDDGRHADRPSRRDDRPLPSSPRSASPPRPSVPPFLPGVIVKIKSPALRKEGYYNQKGEIVALSEGGRTADVEVLSSGDLVRVDRAELETVIPNPGGSVLVLAGSRCGERGVVTKIDVDRYRAIVDLGGGDERAFAYEKISKAAKK